MGWPQGWAWVLPPVVVYDTHFKLCLSRPSISASSLPSPPPLAAMGTAAHGGFLPSSDQDRLCERQYMPIEPVADLENTFRGGWDRELFPNGLETSFSTLYYGPLKHICWPRKAAQLKTHLQPPSGALQHLLPCC